jgi:hypothetical protein
MKFIEDKTTIWEMIEYQKNMEKYQKKNFKIYQQIDKENLIILMVWKNPMKDKLIYIIIILSLFLSIILR